MQSWTLVTDQNHCNHSPVFLVSPILDPRNSMVLSQSEIAYARLQCLEAECDSDSDSQSDRGSAITPPDSAVSGWQWIRDE